jgi:hypothetical protein
VSFSRYSRTRGAGSVQAVCGRLRDPAITLTAPLSDAGGRGSDLAGCTPNAPPGEHALSPGTRRARGGVADSISGGNALATLHRVDDGQDGLLVTVGSNNSADR